MGRLARAIIGFVAMLGLASPAFADEPGRRGDPPLEIGLILPAQQEGYRMTMSVDIDDKGPFEFLIDTGAEATVVSDLLAGHLGLDDHGSVLVHSVGGASQKPVVWIEQMVLGPLTIDRRRAVVMAEAAIGAAGIIGIDSLKDQRVVLDFEEGTVSVSPSRSLLDKDGHDVLIDAKEKDRRLVIHNARIDGIPVDVVIDTGLNITVGNAALRRKLDPKEQVVLTTTITDANGNLVPSQIKILRNLRIDSLHLPSPMIAFADTRVFEQLGLTDRPAILLGMNHLRMFRSVAVDFRRKQIAFDLYRKGG